MQVVKLNGWIYYLSNDYEAVERAYDLGKWLIFTKNADFATKICEDAVQSGIIQEAKHSEDFSSDGVCCFYLSESDFDRHERFISYFIDKGYLPKKKNGSYVNLAFKMDEEEALATYATRSHSLHLKQFIDLDTGNFTANFKKESRLKAQLKKIDSYTCKYLGLLSGEMSRNAIGSDKLKAGDGLNIDLIKNKLDETQIPLTSLAEKIEVSPATIKGWLNGKSRPYAWNAFAIAVYLDIPASDIIIPNCQSNKKRLH